MTTKTQESQLSLLSSKDLSNTEPKFKTNRADKKQTRRVADANDDISPHPAPVSGRTARPSKRAPKPVMIADPEVGVTPQPRPTTPQTPVFDTENYTYINRNSIINLPIRPDSLDKRGHDKFRNVIKKIAISLEKSNSNQIIAYRRDPHWWQCGGNSLLFYKHFLEKEYHLPVVNPRVDNDYGCRWPGHGDCFMIHDIAMFAQHLITKAHACPILRAPELLILELPRSFSDVEIAAFRSIKKNKEERINKLLLPKIVNPHTRQSLDALATIVVNRVCKLSDPQRQIYGYTGAQVLNQLSLDFIKMSNGHMTAEAYYIKALDYIADFMAWLANIQKYNIFNTTELCRIAELTVDVKERFTNELTIIHKRNEESQEAK